MSEWNPDLPTEEEIAEDGLLGINCAMEVLSFAGPEIGLSDEDALRMGSAFGGGMEHGGVCGCLTAAYIALGMKFGMAEAGDLAALIRFRQLKRELDRRFVERFGGVNCPEVLRFLRESSPVPVQDDSGVSCAGVMIETCSILRGLLSDES